MSSFMDRLLGRRLPTGSGKSAKERLQLVLITDRSDISPEKMQAMKDEIMAVISKYVNIARDKVVISIEQSQRDSRLVADIPILPDRDKDRALSTGLEDA